MSTVPLYKAIDDYFRVLAGTQRLAKVWALTGESFSDLTPVLSANLAWAGTTAPVLIQAVADRCPSATLSPWYQRIISEALTETQAVVAGSSPGTMGKAFGGIADFLRTLAATPTAKKIGTWVLSGLGFVAAVKLLPWAWYQLTDPDGFGRGVENIDFVQRECARSLSAAGTDPAAIQLAKQKCAMLMGLLKQALADLGSDDSSCGLTDTPIALGIGLIAGGALAWRFIGDVME